ncbi:hypothetical protein [Chryseobacterium sp.]|uniref:hypothetical protein n=1 Tax=Chryseobacterium sp. TaxID=1871047 RepID=UPI00321BDD46
MDSKEYRIGNLLRDKVSKTILEVIKLTKDDVVTYVIDRSKFPLKKGWGLEPIPLNEEWLLKFDFDKITNDEEEIFYQKGYVRISIDEYEDGWFNFRKRTPSQLWKDNLVTQIKFVHELQNLYLLIEKEELNIR